MSQKTVPFDVNNLINTLKWAGRLFLTHAEIARKSGQDDSVVKHYTEAAEACFRALPESAFDVIATWKPEDK